jgi:hypothetical protein
VSTTAALTKSSAYLLASQEPFFISRRIAGPSLVRERTVEFAYVLLCLVIIGGWVR